jgi:hypothetical protein
MTGLSSTAYRTLATCCQTAISSSSSHLTPRKAPAATAEYRQKAPRRETRFASGSRRTNAKKHRRRNAFF